MAVTDDTTRLSDPRRLSETTPLSPPTRRRVDLVLASVAGALAVLVAITARGALGAHMTDAATPPPTIAPLASAPPAAAPDTPQAAPQKKGGKGRD